MYRVPPKDVRTVMDHLHDHVGDRWPRQLRRPNTGLVQQAIQSGEGFSGADPGRREGAIWRQTAMEAPGQEYGLIGLIEVG